MCIEDSFISVIFQLRDMSWLCGGGGKVEKRRSLRSAIHASFDEPVSLDIQNWGCRSRS